MNPLFGDISQRYTTATNKQLEIRAYGYDNLYPQLVKLAIESGGQAYACVKTYAKYMFGKGFVNSALNDTIVNAKGEKLYDVLVKIAWDSAYYGGRAFVVKYNVFGQPNELYHMPFEYVRKGAEKKDGMYAVCDFWEGKDGKLPKKDDLTWYYPYDPTTVKVEIGKEGFNDYTGQLFYKSSEGLDKYGTAPVDPELESCISDALVKQYHYSGLSTNFMDNIFIFLANSLDEPARQKMVNLLVNYQGAQNAGRAAILDGIAKEDLHIENLNSSTDSNRHTETELSIRERIRKTFNVPRILLGDDSKGGFSDQGNYLNQSKVYYNEQTEGERSEIAEDFTTVFDGFYFNIGDDFTILPIVNG